MEQAVENKDPWGGGDAKPLGSSYGKLMMWFFLMTDALTFSGFLAAYGFSRFKYADVWPVAEDVFTHFPFLHGEHPLLFVALMTFILILSSVTMVLAVNYGHKMEKKKVILWLSLTIVGGILFLSSQAWEWAHFIHGLDGVPATLVSNPYGHPLFGDYFFFITGFHGFHVLSGVVILTIILINVIKGTYEERGHYEMVEKVGLYWHFVDLVWVFVFTFFYLV
ncbi:MAG: cytochrome c oxidase subunit 3 [Flavobacteriales bacterium]|nr:cytochrome c oxidase subunit 3 [Flavobacteriales bacterium]